MSEQESRSKRTVAEWISDVVAKDDGEYISNCYDKWAKTYDADNTAVNFKGPKLGLQFLEKYAGKNDTILDCGSGTGLLGELTKPAGFTNIHAVDCSQASLDIAGSRGAYSKLIKAFITNNVPELKTDTYDTLITISCFAPNHFKPDVVNEMCRVVKPGGHVILLINTIWLSEWVYKDGKLGEAFEQLVQDGRWTRVEKHLEENFYRTDTGVVHVFRIN